MRVSISISKCSSQIQAKRTQPGLWWKWFAGFGSSCNDFTGYLLCCCHNHFTCFCCSFSHLTRNGINFASTRTTAVRSFDSITPDVPAWSHVPLSLPHVQHGGSLHVPCRCQQSKTTVTKLQNHLSLLLHWPWPFPPCARRFPPSGIQKCTSSKLIIGGNRHAKQRKQVKGHHCTPASANS